MHRLPFSRSASLTFNFLLIVCLGACGYDNQTPTANSNSPTASPAATTAATSAAANTPGPKLNVNTASGPEFQKIIPNFSNRMVHEFEEYRPYRSIQVFRKEIGKYVAPATVAEYEKYIFVPIDVNQADAPTLMQIPGLDQAEAESLIAGRPYASPQAFLAKLADKVSAADLDVARTYLSQQ
jgi:DNA uptake protein ComE-like DNA-binding protein